MGRSTANSISNRLYNAGWFVRLNPLRLCKAIDRPEHTGTKTANE